MRVSFVFVISVWSVLLMDLKVNGKLARREVSSEFRELLESTKPGFEEYLVRAFRNEGIRNQQNGNGSRSTYKLDDVLMSLEDTNIELRKLLFPWIPDFRVVTLSVDFSMLCLDVSFKLGDLTVEGEYEANSLTLQKVLPIFHNGKLEVTFKDVTAIGRVGLLPVGDSLVPKNYDIEYKPAGTDLSVKYYISNGNAVETKQTSGSLIGDAVWTQLTDHLSGLLHRQLGEAVVEMSLTELLADEDEQLRQMARERTQRANRLLDSVLCTAKDYILLKNYRAISTPRFSVNYRGKQSQLHEGELKTSRGFIQDLATLSRPEDLSLYEDREKLVIYGSLALREFKHGYQEFTSRFETTHVYGSIKAGVYNNKIAVKLSILKTYCDPVLPSESIVYNPKIHLDTIHVSSVKDIDVDASGLAYLSWLAPKLERWVIGYLRYSAVPELEKYIEEAFLYAIQHSDCASLLAD